MTAARAELVDAVVDAARRVDAAQQDAQVTDEERAVIEAGGGFPDEAALRFRAGVKGRDAALAALHDALVALDSETARE